MFKTIALICYFLCFYLNLACSKNNKEIWLTYNVQNLFDDQFDKTEYKDFKPAGDGKDKDTKLNVVTDLTSKYDSDLKIRQLSHVLTQIKKEYGKLGVVILQEVENDRILRILHANTLSLQPLEMVFAKQKHHAVGLTILTRHPIKKIEQLDTSHLYEQARPILLVTISINNQEIVIIGVHLPSKRKKSNTKIRHDILRFLYSHIQKALANNQMVFFGGDMNEDLTQISPTIFPQLDTKTPRIKDESLLKNGYDHMDYQEFQRGTYPHNIEWGTYYFRKQWSKLDHLLFSSHFFDQKGLELEKVFIYKPNFLLRHTNHGDIPHSFQKRSLERFAGYSDHLPLIAIIEHK